MRDGVKQSLPPKVSVVIPAYNQADYLPQTLDSVLAQSFTDYEVIVVDDGSTDETPAVARQYQEQIRLIRQENQGLAGARNTGIAAARAPFVALLDSDDCWEPDYLAKMMALAAANPETAVFYCGVSYMNPAGQLAAQSGHSQVVAPDSMYATLLRVNFLVPSTILMRRKAATAVGCFDPNFRRLQDWELWIRMLRQGYKFAGLHDRLVRYRLHDSSLSTDPRGGQRAALALAVKHFGTDDGAYANWPADKRRMYGGVYRYYALTSSLVRAGDWQACAVHLHQALCADPNLVTDLDLFYELALGAQPMGQRGTAETLRLQVNAKRVEQILAHGCGPASNMAPYCEAMYRIAYYALGLVGYNVGDYGATRRFLRKSSRWNGRNVSAKQIGLLWVKALIKQMQSR